MNIYKLGIMVNSLDLSQQGFYIIKQLNKIVDEDYKFSPTVFYKDYAKSIDVNRFCMLLEKEVWDYEGNVIATDLKTAQTLITCPCPRKKFFYVWNFEWVYNQNMYLYLQSIYQNEELELIARTKDHAKVIQKCWKAPAYIMDNFEDTILKQLAQLS